MGWLVPPGLARPGRASRRPAGAPPRRVCGALLALAAFFSAGALAAEPSAPSPPSAPAPRVVDRVVARWSSSATGGPSRPQFILARELAFEARIEALAEGYVGNDGYADKHVRAAMRRHVTETLLAALPVDRAPSPAKIAEYAHAARLMAEERVGGAERLLGAARAEGLDHAELNSLWRRQARASTYLDRMVAPMLEPTDADLREAYDRGALASASGRSFAELAPELRRTVVARRLAQALERYFRSAQQRIAVELIVPVAR